MILTSHISMTQEQHFLGIDGGGSRCRARIRDSKGTILSEATGGPCNIYQDFDGALATIINTAKDAADTAGLTTQHIHAGLGLAGLVTSVSSERVMQANLPFASVTVDNDAAAACQGAFAAGDGGIVIAGTGSIGFAKVKGARHMAGGWGFALGDHGSGAWLGHHALRRTALAMDGLLQPTPLIEHVMQRAGKDRSSLSRWSEHATPRDYGQFAPLVFECASRGDVHAMLIVIEGAAAISSLGRALLARGARRLCLLGGLSGVYPPYLDADVRGVMVQPVADAVDGAIMMARKAQGFEAVWQGTKP
jgi:glucosamine kinase